ncbi:M48 family metalloprotease [bacterium]|nr:M48 family metalloprotease [bacterium]
MKRARLSHVLMLCLAASLTAVISPSYPDSYQDEEKMGREYAERMEKTMNIVDDQTVVERVERIGDKLAKIAGEYEVHASYGDSKIAPFKYRFKVVDDPDVNAFALPGGYIYVNKGLLEMVESDDELAGVLAHEIAHIAHHHTTKIIKEQSKLDKYMALIALVGIFGKVRGSDFNNLLLGAQMLKVGSASSHTMEAERDADRTAVAYMVKSSYKPDGLLAFMQKLDRKQAENPTLPLGIYKDHPSPYRRVGAVMNAMVAEGLAPNVRKIRGVAYAQAVPISEGSSQFKVIICDREVCTPAPLADGTTSKDRAEVIAKKINNMLDSGISARTITENTAQSALVAGNIEILKVEPEDRQAQKNSNEELLAQAKSALNRAAWADWLSNECVAVQELAGASD